jgi:hypothetical protein
MRRAVAVEIESPLPELYAAEESYWSVVEEVAGYVAERGTLEKEKYNDLYRRFRGLYPLPAQGADEDRTRTPPTWQAPSGRRSERCLWGRLPLTQTCRLYVAKSCPR